MDGRPWVTHQQGDSAAIWLPRWGLGRLGRFIGAGSLCDQLGGVSWVWVASDREFLSALYADGTC